MPSTPKHRRQKRKPATSTATKRRPCSRTRAILNRKSRARRKCKAVSVRPGVCNKIESKIIVGTKRELQDFSLCSTMKDTIKDVTLRHSFQIQRSLNFTELLPALVHPDLQFLDIQELEHLQKQVTDAQKANELLLFLAIKSSMSACKFLAGLWLTREHRGHEDVFCNIFPHVPEECLKTLIHLCKCIPSSSPRKLPKLIEVQGDLTEDKFLTVQSCLWDYFGKGKYSQIAQVTSELRSSPSIEWAIVGMWFESLNCALIHQCVDHQQCVQQLLVPALKHCKLPQVVNGNILEGRIYLRMAQVFLTRGEIATATEYSERAKELLSLTRGYDRAKLFLREAKVFSALSLVPRREVQMLYEYALDNFDEDHACCRPTAHLSLAAFLLHISFASKPDTESQSYPVCDEDMEKAKAHLEAVDGVFLPSLRLCEQKILQAELLRLEGNLGDAISAFGSAKQMCLEAELHNLFTIAEHRLELTKLNVKKCNFLDNIIISCIQK